METMSPPRVILFALVTVGVVLSTAAPVAAQAELLQWVAPTLGKMMGRGDYRIQFYSDERVEGQDTHLDLTPHHCTLVPPLFQNSTDGLAMSARLRYQV